MLSEDLNLKFTLPLTREESNREELPRSFFWCYGNIVIAGYAGEGGVGAGPIIPNRSGGFIL